MKNKDDLDTPQVNSSKLELALILNPGILLARNTFREQSSMMKDEIWPRPENPSLNDRITNSETD